ncbi:hypothetical protein BMS3Abin04_02394 [bacterium BMS3Abin04]|nr:hypothetical protein BMS3Abin04_02394 [bacterium BMS3Abin04]
MKTKVFFSLVLLFCNLNAKSNIPAIKINSYNIITNVTDTSMNVNVTLSFSKLSDKALDQIDFLFSSKANVDSVKYWFGNEWISTSYKSGRKNSIIVYLPKYICETDNCKLMFVYSYPIELQKDSVLLLDRGHRWYPLILNQIFKYKLTTYIQRGYQVLSSGNLIEEIQTDKRSVFTWESKKPVFKLPLIVFNPSLYNKTQLSSQNWDLVSYSLKQDTTNIRKLLKQIDSTMNYYSKTLGSYSYKKLTLFETKEFRGINVGSGLLTIGKESLDMINKGYKDLMILTVAQQWFGASVFADFNKPGFFFLVFSLPHFLRLMYVNQSEGEKAFNKSIQRDMNRYRDFAGTEKDIPIINIDKPNTKEKSIILYAKGPWILSKIQEQMGEENWITFLKDLYTSSRGKVITFKTFTNYLTKNDKTGNAAKLLLKLVNEKGISGK